MKDDLQAKLKEAQDAEESRKRMNETKINAAKTAADYEEFRQAVLGSNLKPMNGTKPLNENTDGITLLCASELPRDAEKRQASANATNKLLQQAFVSPSTVSEFYRGWRAINQRQSKENSDKYQDKMNYLIGVNNINIMNFMKIDCDSDFLSDIISLFKHIVVNDDDNNNNNNNSNNNNNVTFIHSFLLGLAQLLPKIKLSLKMLSKCEKEELCKVIDVINTSNGNNNDSSFELIKTEIM